MWLGFTVERVPSLRISDSSYKRIKRYLIGEEQKEQKCEVANEQVQKVTLLRVANGDLVGCIKFMVEKLFICSLLRGNQLICEMLRGYIKAAGATLELNSWDLSLPYPLTFTAT